MTDAPPLVTDRQLNRTTLARQLLLERVNMPAIDAVDHLVGLQAQIPQNPYIALWSRLIGFEPAEVEQLLTERQLVRLVVMRGTVHLLRATKSRGIRRVTQPVMDAEISRHSEHKAKLVDVDMGPVLQLARRELAATGPLSNRDLREALATAFPDLDAPAVAYACRCYLPLVQVPPRGLWSRSGIVRTALADDWLEHIGDDEVTIDELVLCYLAAFGPASTADVAAWSRLTAIREVTDRLELRRYRDERGRELLDLPGAVLIDPETPAPTRFLPEYDNALLSHHDRRRFLDEATMAGLGRVDGPIQGTVLVDGFISAVWRIDRSAGSKLAKLVVSTARRLPTGALKELEAGAHDLAGFALGDEASVEVRDFARD